MNFVGAALAAARILRGFAITMRQEIEIIIRKANLSDLSAIIALSSDLMAYDIKFDASMDIKWPNTDAAFLFYQEKIASKNGIIFVAVCAEEIIGCLIGGLVEPLCYSKIKILAELEEFFVKENFRDNKVGTKLTEYFFAWCLEMQAEKIQVRVSAGNYKAIDLYKKIGFKDHDVILEM